MADIHDAAWEGDFKRVKQLVERESVSVNAPNDFRETPLYVACASYNDNLSLVEFLVGKGADIHASVDDGSTPLHTASWGGRLSIVEFLVGKGANIYAQNKDGKTPPDLAREQGKWDVVSFLQQGKPVPLTDMAPIHTAAQDGYLNLVKQLVEQRGVSVDLEDICRRTPLHEASSFGRLPVVKWLVGKGANIHAQDYEGKTPLDIARKSGELDVVSFLEQELQRNKQHVQQSITTQTKNPAASFLLATNRSTPDSGPKNRQRPLFVKESKNPKPPLLKKETSKTRQPVQSLIGRLEKMEISVFGHSQSGTALDRTTSLELELEGKSGKGGTKDRIEKLEAALGFGTEGTPTPRFEKRTKDDISTVFLSHTGQDGEAATLADFLHKSLRSSHSRRLSP